MDFSAILQAVYVGASVIAAFVALGAIKVSPNAARWVVGKLTTFFDEREFYREHVAEEADRADRNRRYLSHVREDFYSPYDFVGSRIERETRYEHKYED